MSTFVELSDDAFGALFKPILNPINDNASFDFGNGQGVMFETYGNEFELVKAFHKREPRTIWTLCSGDDGDFIQSGFHFVNRLGYFITENPAPEGIDIQVTLFRDSGREIQELASDLLTRVETVLADYDFCASHRENDIEYKLHRIRGEAMMAERIYRDDGSVEDPATTLDQLNEIAGELAPYEAERVEQSGDSNTSTEGESHDEV